MAAEPGGDYLDRPLRALFDDVAGAESVPAAGSVIAALGALSAGLTAKVAHRSAAQLHDSEEIARRAHELRAKLEPIITADAVGYAAALAKRGLARADAMQSLSSELGVIVETAAEIAELASALAIEGNQNLRYDAEAAARIAATVAEVGASLIGANVGGAGLSRDAGAAVGRAQAAAQKISG